MTSKPGAGRQAGRAIAAPERLDSWKAIADHLGRHISTVQRWEREEGLPVLRHVHDKRGSVYAHVDDIEAWLQGRSRARSESPPAALFAPDTSDRARLALAPSQALARQPWWTPGAGMAVGLLVVVAVAALTMPGGRMPTAPPRVVSPPADVAASAEALAEYWRGRSLWNRRRKPDFELAQKYYVRALNHDPTLGLAYVGLADTYALRTSGLPTAETARQGTRLATKALELDPTSGEAMASLAKLRVRAWDWAAAEAGFRNAIEHAPDYAPAHYWYASLLAYHRRCHEAADHVKDAERLEPVALPVQHVAVLADLACGDLADADRRLALMQEFDPEFPPTYSLAGRASLAVGDLGRAIAAFEQGVTVTDNSASARAQLAHAYALAGRTHDATRIADGLRQEHEVAPGDVPAWGMALIAVGLSRSGEAMMWLERAYDAQEDHLKMLAIDARFASLHDHRGFRRLLRMLRLPDPERPSLTDLLSIR